MADRETGGYFPSFVTAHSCVHVSRYLVSRIRRRNRTTPPISMREMARKMQIHRGISGNAGWPWAETNAHFLFLAKHQVLCTPAIGVVSWAEGEIMLRVAVAQCG